MTRPKGGWTDGRRLPWVQWSWDAWMSDPGLRVCSLAARGMWADMLALANRADEPGFVLHAGRNPTMNELSRWVGCSPKQATRCLAELEAARVFSRDDRGRIYSRRMVREAAAHEAAVANGKGGGNPILLGSDTAAVLPKVDQSAPKVLPKFGKSRPKEMSECREDSGLGRNGVNPRVIIDSDSDSDSDEKKEKSTTRSIPLVLAEDDDDDAPVVVRAGEAVDASVVVQLRPPSGPPSPPPSPRVGWTPPVGVGEPTAEEVEAVAIWNAAAVRTAWFLPGELFPERLVKLRARLRDCGGLEGWRAAVARAEATPLWLGQVGKGWRPGLDSILSEGRFRSLMEGAHDQWVRPPSAPPVVGHRLAGVMGRLGMLGGNDDDRGGPIIDAAEV